MRKATSQLQKKLHIWHQFNKGTGANTKRFDALPVPCSTYMM
jgi:hypothetical protein